MLELLPNVETSVKIFLFLLTVGWRYNNNKTDNVPIFNNIIMRIISSPESPTMLSYCNDEKICTRLPLQIVSSTVDPNNKIFSENQSNIIILLLWLKVLHYS